MRRGLFALGAAMLIGAAVTTRSIVAKPTPAPLEITVQFAMAQPQPPQAGTPGTPDNSSTHFLTPDDATIRKGARSPSSSTAADTGLRFIRSARTRLVKTSPRISARVGRTRPIAEAATRCVMRTIVNLPVDVNGVPTVITGTDNLNYTITDGKGNPVIVTGFNLTAANSSPSTIIANPRVDDSLHTHRLLATSGRSPGDVIESGGDCQQSSRGVPDRYRLQHDDRHRDAGTPDSGALRQDRAVSRDLHEPFARPERPHVRLHQRRRRR